MSGIEPRLAGWKTNVLPTVLLLLPLITHYLFIFGFGGHTQQYKWVTSGLEIVPGRLEEPCGMPEIKPGFTGIDLVQGNIVPYHSAITFTPNYTFFKEMQWTQISICYITREKLEFGHDIYLFLSS